MPRASPSMRFTSRSFDEKGCSATRRNRRESTTFDTRSSPMAASAASTALPHASRESGSSANGTAARWRGGAEATMRMKRATRPGYTGPSEFTCKKRPRPFSMSTISGSMNRNRGNDAISSSAGAGLVASKRFEREEHRRLIGGSLTSCDLVQRAALAVLVFHIAQTGQRDTAAESHVAAGTLLIVVNELVGEPFLQPAERIHQIRLNGHIACVNSGHLPSLFALRLRIFVESILPSAVPEDTKRGWRRKRLAKRATHVRLPLFRLPQRQFWKL